MTLIWGCMAVSTATQFAQRVWRGVRVRMLRRLTRADTWAEHAARLELCKEIAKRPLASEAKDDPVYGLSERLRSQTLAAFKDRYAGEKELRVMIHVPSHVAALGGTSLFRNWIDGLRYLGIATEELGWKSDTTAAIKAFKPSVLFTSDSASYTEQFDWEFIRQYRAERRLDVLLTTSRGDDGNSPNAFRLDQAKKRGVAFFISFREQEYIDAYLKDWGEWGFDVLSLPFSANPLLYSYVPLAEKPLDFVFLASSNHDKVSRYWDYLRPIFRKYRGVINGPGWGQNELIFDLAASREIQKHLYAMGAIGINLHIPVQVEEISELNERAYTLACCGAFQLIDHPRTLDRVFPPGTIASADSAREYQEKFRYFLERPAERTPFILKGMERVYDGHTIFHRMESFVKKLLSLRAPAGVAKS